MKNKFLGLFFLLFSVRAFAADCEQNQFIKAVSVFGETVTEALSPFYISENCELKNLEPKCQKLFSSAAYKDLNWKEYSNACTQKVTGETEFYNVIAGCLGDIKDLGISLGESFAIQEMNQEKLKQCNQSLKMKEDLITIYNVGVPNVLKFKSPKNLNEMTCSEIQMRVNSFYHSRKQKWLVKISFNAKDSDLTKDELKFKKWIELQYARAALNNMDQNVFAYVKEQFENLSCYNYYYKSKLTCRLLASATGLRLAMAPKAELVAKKIIQQEHIFQDTVQELGPHLKPREVGLYFRERKALIERINAIEKEMLGDE